MFTVSLPKRLAEKNMLAFTCSNTTIKAPEKSIKHVWYKMCSKLTKKAPERRQWFRTYFTYCSVVSIVEFEQVNVGWGGKLVF